VSERKKEKRAIFSLPGIGDHLNRGSPLPAGIHHLI